MSEFTRCDSFMCPRLNLCRRWLSPRANGDLLYAVPPYELEGSCDAFLPLQNPYRERHPVGLIIDEMA